MKEIKFFQCDEEVKVTRHRLPHWQQDGCACAVTFRLADSLPHHLLDVWRSERAAWLFHHPEPWTETIEQEYHQRFTERVQGWLDAGHGECVLRDSRASGVVAACLQKNRAGAGRILWAFAVMPNHVHVLLSFDGDCDLSRMIRLWKGGSARAINLALKRRGRLWQPDYFDRLVRTPQHFMRCLDYIRDNPVKAKLPVNASLCRENPDARTRLADYVAKHGAV